MGLFDKKYCDICGEKIGLLGNKKLEDANMCKKCAKNLSPWFKERRHTDLEGIKEQLADREANRDRVAAFNATYAAGEKVKVYIDEKARTFMATKVDLSNKERLEEENPDVISLDNVLNCTVEPESYRTELHHTNSQGESVSYDPPRYEYHYDFKFKITLNHPYLDEIKFDLNNRDLVIEYSDNSLFGLGTLHPENDFEYRRYINMGNELTEHLTSAEQVEAAPQAQNEQGNSVPLVTCPYCGSKSRLTTTGRCENCGGILEG